MTELDPRVAATTVVTGPADLVGNTLVRVEEVTITGQVVHLPASIPGVPQYVAVARAEADANALWPRLMTGLDRRGPIPYQPNAALVIDFQAAVGSAIAGAVTGLEAFSSHHLGRYAAPGQSVIHDGRPYTLRELRDAFSLNQRYADVMPAVMGVPAADPGAVVVNAAPDPGSRSTGPACRRGADEKKRSDPREVASPTLLRPGVRRCCADDARRLRALLARLDLARAHIAAPAAGQALTDSAGPPLPARPSPVARPMACTSERCATSSRARGGRAARPLSSHCPLITVSDGTVTRRARRQNDEPLSFSASSTRSETDRRRVDDSS